MRVLGIDPGSRATGWALVEECGGGLARLAGGVAAPRGDLAERLGRLAASIDDVIGRWRPETMAVERAFLGKNVASALRLGEVRGALYAVAGRRGLPVVDYAPATVKVAVTGHGQAEKEMVAAGVRRILGGEAEAGDATDALAVAICHLRHAAFARRLEPAAGAKPARRAVSMARGGRGR